MTGGGHGAGPLARGVAWATALYLLLPIGVVVPVSLTDQRFLSLPYHAPSLRHYANLFTSEAWLGAMWQSFWLALASTALAVAAGGAVTGLMPLPIAGLLAETPPGETAASFARLRAAADAVMQWKPPFRVFRGVTGISLACNPGPHPTDLGITDGGTGEVRDPALPIGAEPVPA